MFPIDHAEITARVIASVRATYAGRPWLVATDIVQSAVHTATRLQANGASSVFAIGASRGTGDVDEGVDHACLEVRADGMMQSIRAGESALAALPAQVQARVDAWDPTREARVVRTLFASGDPVAGRRAWGGRRPEWLALEDKTVIDAVWDACGVPRQPAEVVTASEDALLQAHHKLDQGHGTVWAADNREGWHGGATGTRWVRTPAEAREVATWMAAHAWKVRVMPFVEGVPCSIHGIVFPDHVVALRPCEMVVFRNPATGRFKYGQAATFWDPPAEDRAQMREMVRKTGAHLRETVGYRGTFTIDGVMGAGGFMPTELNPRFGAAIGVLARSLPELELYLLHLAIVEGVALDFTAQELESVLLHAADTHRHGSSMQVLDRRIDDSKKACFDYSAAGWTPSSDPDSAHAIAHLGPSPAGGFLRITIDSSQVPVGTFLAPRLTELFQLLDARWRLGIGQLEAAVPCR